MFRRATNLILAGAAILIGWMHFWTAELVSSSQVLVMDHANIARQFDMRAPLAELDERGNAELTRSLLEHQRSAAVHAKANLRDDYRKVEHAKFMLSWSRWATVAGVVALLALFASRYRLRIDKHRPDGQIVEMVGKTRTEAKATIQQA